MQVFEGWLFSMKSQFIQARRRWRDEPATEENWELMLQSVAHRLRLEQEEALKQSADKSDEELAGVSQILRNLDIKCSMYQWKNEFEVLGLQEKVRNQYREMSFQFYDIDEASKSYM